MQKKIKILAGAFGCIAIVVGSLLAYFYISQPSRIYYQVDYSGTLPNMNSVIQRIEGLNYSDYINSTGYDFFSYMPVNFANHTVIDDLTAQIDSDKYFHWQPLYSHYLKYLFSATHFDTITVSYNNDTIANITSGIRNRLGILARGSELG